MFKLSYELIYIDEIMLIEDNVLKIVQMNLRNINLDSNFFILIE